MTILATDPRLASAYAVDHGRRGAVTRQARQRGVSRQRVYREADWVRRRLAADPLRQHNEALRQQRRAAQQRLGQLEGRLGQAVVLDDAKQAELAAAARPWASACPRCASCWMSSSPAGRPAWPGWAAGPRPRPAGRGRCWRCWTSGRRRGWNKSRPTKSMSAAPC